MGHVKWHGAIRRAPFFLESLFVQELSAWHVDCFDL